MANNEDKSSPGNAYSEVRMTMPSLEFIYRLDCEMARTNFPVGAPFDGSDVKIIMPIVGGTVHGPKIDAIIEHMSGADWGTKLKGTDFMRLDARYTLKTNDGHWIYVQSKGIFSPTWDHAPVRSEDEPRNITQKETDWFTRLEFQTDGGPYNWMNGIFAIGVLSMSDGRINIDAYRVTNFPGVTMNDLKAKV